MMRIITSILVPHHLFPSRKFFPLKFKCYYFLKKKRHDRVGEIIAVKSTFCSSKSPGFSSHQTALKQLYLKFQGSKDL